MKRQHYYPKLVPDQSEWHFNYAVVLEDRIPDLSLDPAAAAASVNDSRYLGYALGVWRTAVRDFGPGTTAQIKTLRSGRGSAPLLLPVFTAPPLPPGVTPALPGALNRIFKFVQTIKASPGYTQGIGLMMGIVGRENSAGHARPDFSLKLEQGQLWQCVRVRFRRWGRHAVVIYSRRGGGDWELLGIATDSPFQDARPLLVPGQPEVREYRLRFWDKGDETGDWTDTAQITVSP